METTFQFNDITKEDLIKYADSSHIFNNLKSSIEKEHVLLASFSDERFGSSIENLEIALYNNEWELLNISTKIDGYNDIPLSYVLEGLEYTKVLIILRRMSNMVFDKCKSSISTYVYNVVDAKYAGIESDKKLYGILAKNCISFSDLDSLCEDSQHIQDTRDKEYVLSWINSMRESEGLL